MAHDCLHPKLSLDLNSPEYFKPFSRLSRVLHHNA